MVNQCLRPSVPKWAARIATEVALDATDYEAWARTRDFTPQAEVDAGRIPDGTIVKPSGKIQRTADADAGQGHRSREPHDFNGWWGTLAVAARPIVGGRRGRAVTPHILTMAVTPADEEAGPIGYRVTVQAKQLAPNLKVVKADQHDTRKHETFTRPLRKQGWEIVMNQSVDELTTVRTITAGTTPPCSYIAAPSCTLGRRRIYSAHPTT